MSIRLSFSGQDESIEGFEAAAENKYEAGFNLMASAQSGEGVNVIGYVGELLLKSSYFRIIGLSDTTPITRQHLRDARAEAASLGAVSNDEQFHNIEFWGELVIKKRIQQGRSLPGAFQTQLEYHTQRLAQNWFVEMRYHDLQGVDIKDVEDVLDDIIWIKTNYKDFWR